MSENWRWVNEIWLQNIIQGFSAKKVFLKQENTYAEVFFNKAVRRLKTPIF